MRAPLIIGKALGEGMNGYRPIVELMNANFGIYGMAELSSSSQLNMSRFVTETTQRVPQKVLYVKLSVGVTLIMSPLSCHP